MTARGIITNVAGDAAAIAIEAALERAGYRITHAPGHPWAMARDDSAARRAIAALAKDLAATPYDDLRDIISRLVGAVDRHRRWVADLQAGTFVTCVYCGHQYGPGETTPVTMADALKAHVAQCPEHPMAALADVGVAAWHALKSYQFGNAEQALAEMVVDKLAAALAAACRTVP